MRNPVLNILTLIALVSLCGVSAFVLAVFFNPDSTLNPFPPPTMPAGIVLPSETPTPQSMPPTWTPGPGTASPTTQALAPTSTPLATSTGFTLPTYTPTPTATDTETPTPTITDTSEPTDTKAPTKTPKPVNIDIQLTDFTLADGSATTGTATLKINVLNNSTTKVSVGLTNSFTKKMTTITWTCAAATGVTCKNGKVKSASSFSTTLTMNGGGSVEVDVAVTFTVPVPPAVVKAFNTTAQINASGNYAGNTHDAKTLTINP